MAESTGGSRFSVDRDLNREMQYDLYGCLWTIVRYREYGQMIEVEIMPLMMKAVMLPHQAPRGLKRADVKLSPASDSNPVNA